MKRLTVFFTVFCVALSMTSTLWGQTEKINYKLGHMLAIDTPWHKTAVLFADKVKEYTKGGVEVVVYPAQQLGDERTLVEGLFTGAIDFMILGSFSVGGVPEVMVGELPYLYKSYAHISKAMPEVVIPYTNSRTIPKGARALDGVYAYTAYRGVLSKNKPINTLADMKGIKIRVPQNPMLMNTFKAMGANPTVVNYGELYTALQTGVVEACELTPELLVGAKLHETSKYFSFTNHIAYPLYFGINEKSWQKSGKYQPDLVRAAAEAMGLWRSQNQDNDNNYIQVMKDSGVKITDPGDAERQKFREAVQAGAWKEFFEKYPDTKAIADKVLALQ
jgi:tripartite ATP-independent transporter DctP family solute receptor